METSQHCPAKRRGLKRVASATVEPDTMDRSTPSSSKPEISYKKAVNPEKAQNLLANRSLIAYRSAIQYSLKSHNINREFPEFWKDLQYSMSVLSPRAAQCARLEYGDSW